MDTSSLQDVIQYAGVDLKAESELIMRETEMHHQRARATAGSQGPYHDETRQQSFVAPFSSLQGLVRRAVAAAGLKSVEADVEVYLAIALETRMRHLLQKAIQASKARMEVSRDGWDLELVDGLNALAAGGGEPSVYLTYFNDYCYYYYYYYYIYIYIYIYIY
jgi:hypothetical protein